MCYARTVARSGGIASKIALWRVANADVVPAMLEAHNRVQMSLLYLATVHCHQGRWQMIEAADIKIAVLQVALGIKALEDKELFYKLEEFWISAYARGREDAGSQPADVGISGSGPTENVENGCTGCYHYLGRFVRLPACPVHGS
jgi:hypothetical protein